MLVLLVDDNTDLRECLAYDLEAGGITVVQAKDGRHALELLLAHAVDLIVSDIQMPRMDGVELLERVKAMRPEIPVILMTGGAAITKTEACAKGAVALFLKGCEQMELLERVRRFTA